MASFKHGRGGYKNHGCRCAKCTEAVTAYHKEWRARQEVVPDRVHGTSNGYTNYGCRCSDCREAIRMAHRRRKGMAG